MSVRVVYRTGTDVKSEHFDSVQAAVSTLEKMLETTLEQDGEAEMTLRDSEGNDIRTIALEPL